MKKVASSRLITLLFLASMFVVSAQARTAASPAPAFLSSVNAVSTDSNVFFGEYDFDLYNRTSGWVLNGFYTNEDGKWSKNWLSAKLQPGKSFHMMWNSASDTGACVVPFKLTWDDYDSAEIYKLDWCKGIKNVYLKDNTFTVDYK